MNAEEEPQEDLATQSEEVGYSRRTFGLSLFFLVSAAAVLVVWWLALRSPVALTKLYKHYVDIDYACREHQHRLHRHDERLLYVGLQSADIGYFPSPPEKGPQALARIHRRRA